MILVVVSDSLLQVDLCWFGLVRCVLVVLCSFVNKKFVHPKKSIVSFLHDCLDAAWTYMKEVVNITRFHSQPIWFVIREAIQEYKRRRKLDFTVSLEISKPLNV